MVGMNLILRLFTIVVVALIPSIAVHAKNDSEQLFKKEMQIISVNKDKKTVKPIVSLSFSETGIASWYGPGFGGRPTANGDIFNPNLISAAHKYLPLNSVVKVTNLDNKKSIKVIINDRGPYVGKRIIDLSMRAAQLLGFHEKGLAKVKVEYLHDETMDLSHSISPKKRKRLHREIEKISLSQWKEAIKAFQ